ncbi:MAG: hypothetical protein MUC79_01090 [Thiobacillaceae bacterium]|nr:hypothetical protein [Thiobacillaceae bacterium]
MNWILLFAVVTNAGQLSLSRVDFPDQPLCEQARQKVAEHLSGRGNSPAITSVRAVCVQVEK